MATLRSSKDPTAFVKIMGKELPLEKLRTNLARVAKSRGLTGAQLELRLKEDQEPYYNVYKYAFFGKVPEMELDSAAKIVKGRTGKSELFRKK